MLKFLYEEERNPTLTDENKTSFHRTFISYKEAPCLKFSFVEI